MPSRLPNHQQRREETGGLRQVLGVHLANRIHLDDRRSAAEIRNPPSLHERQGGVAIHDEHFKQRGTPQSLRVAPLAFLGS